MHPALLRYLKLEEELNRISSNWMRTCGSTQKEDLLENALGCPFCAKGDDHDRWYKLACQCIVDVLRRNSFDVSAVIDQLNKIHQSKGKPVAVVNDDGSIDFVNSCTNGTSSILKAAAELIE